VQKCKPAYGLCKGAKVRGIDSGGGWQPRVAGGGAAHLWLCFLLGAWCRHEVLLNIPVVRTVITQ
jgi:hypothetical protein